MQRCGVLALVSYVLYAVRNLEWYKFTDIGVYGLSM